MSDIVERLRARKATWMDAIVVMEEAADEIERLRAALNEIVHYPGPKQHAGCTLFTIALDALEGLSVENTIEPEKAAGLLPTRRTG